MKYDKRHVTLVDLLSTSQLNKFSALMEVVDKLEPR